VLNVTNDCFADIGADDNGKFVSIFDMNFLAPNVHPYTDGCLQNSNKINSLHLNTLPTAKGITVNTVHGTQSSIDKTRTLYYPDIESMEGAAFMYVCLLEQVPFAQVRSISNMVEPRNKANWDIPLAIHNLNNTALSIITDLCAKAR
jgi:futalosine hydrolase